jgi:hypothetical protein
MDTKKWTLLLAMMGVLIATAFANDPVDGEDGIRDGRRDKMIEKIAPILDAQRAKLDEVMSTEDQEKVASIKSDLKDQRLMLHGLNCEAGASRIKGEKPDESLREEMRAQMTVIRNLYKEAGEIADKYEDTIEDLMEEVKAGMQSLREEGEKDGAGPGFREEGRRVNGGRRNPGGMFSRGTPEVRFLLWDGVNI